MPLNGVAGRGTHASMPGMWWITERAHEWSDRHPRWAWLVPIWWIWLWLVWAVVKAVLDDGISRWWDIALIVLGVAVLGEAWRKRRRPDAPRGD